MTSFYSGRRQSHLQVLVYSRRLQNYLELLELHKEGSGTDQNEIGDELSDKLLRIQLLYTNDSESKFFIQMSHLLVYKEGMLGGS